MSLDLDGHVADNVFVDLRLTLQLGDDIAGGIDLEHHVMRLAVLGDLVRQATQAPALGFHDPAVIIVDDLGGVFRQCIHLRLCQILARKEHMLIQSHVLSFVLADR